MYPTIYDAVYDLIGLSFPPFKLLQSFGFFVAMAFLAAMWVLSKEIIRREQLGILSGRKEQVWIGQPLAISEYVISSLIGFALGFKFVAIALNFDKATANTQDFILSSEGNLLGGLVFAALAAYVTYRDDPRSKGQIPEEIERTVMPHEQVGTITMIAVVGGILGAKIFHNLENPDQFIANPIEALTSFSGLTFYGGLICAAAGIIYFSRKKGIKVLPLCDSAAPGLILAYGVGRIGCQVAGDGDWGIPNDAPMPGWLSFLPEWVWAYDYPNNVHHIDLRADFLSMGLESITGKAFPTPLYETTMAIVIFAGLWVFRKRFEVPGMMFCTYLIFNGLERFLIEHFRVNVQFPLLGLMVTQAQVISSCLMLIGIGGVIWLKNNPKKLSDW